MSATAQDKGWCLVEMMGHRQMAGYVSNEDGLQRVEVFLADPDVVQAHCGVCDEPLPDGLPATIAEHFQARHPDRVYVENEPGDLFIRSVTPDPISIQWLGTGSIYQISQTSKADCLAFAQRRRDEQVRLAQWREMRELEGPADLDADVEDDYDDEVRDSG